MKWIKELEIGNIIAYIIASILIIGIIVFFVGFFLKVDFGILLGSYSVSSVLNNKLIMPGVDTHTLFTLYQTFDVNSLNIPGITQDNFRSLKSMIDCSIAGFSLIMIAIGLLVVTLLVTFIWDQVDRYKAKKQ